MSRQYAMPLLQTASGTIQLSRKVDWSANGRMKESDLQSLIFSYTEILPTAEIDPAFGNLIPVCKELHTDAGRLDILCVTAQGRLACIETKLWRNPEARREVVGQILDYASELSRWTYEDLQREVRRRTGRSLFSFVSEIDPETDEAQFYDNVSTCLSEGRFMLIVCGDGIRQGTENIARFFNRVTALDFVFALIEVAAHDFPSGDRIYQARTLARTETIQREVRRLSRDTDLLAEAGAETETDDTEDEIRSRTETDQRRAFWLAFWTELATRLTFDDPNHLELNIEKRQRSAGLFKMEHVYLLVYFDRSRKKIGAQLSINQDAKADYYDALHAQREELEMEFDAKLDWYVKPNGRPAIDYSRDYLSPEEPGQREEALRWFSDVIVRFDNVFRPRLERLAEHADLKP